MLVDPILTRADRVHFPLAQTAATALVDIERLLEQISPMHRAEWGRKWWNGEEMGQGVCRLGQEGGHVRQRSHTPNPNALPGPDPPELINANLN